MSIDLDLKREKQREATRRYREKLRDEGRPLRPPLTDAERERQREYMRERRLKAAAEGVVLKSDVWAKANPEKQRSRVTKYRQEHAARTREVSRQDQAIRRSTPWGAINNRIFPVMHGGVRCASDRVGKYNAAAGYTWRQLREHLEAQFTPEMNWDNWGDVWELDHIKPLCLFQYTSLLDPLFREAWALSNLRPLLQHLNASKGKKHSP